jgi:hypothetical protein
VKCECDWDWHHGTPCRNRVIKWSDPECPVRLICDVCQSMCIHEQEFGNTPTEITS